MLSPFELTAYLLAGALVLLGWALCRVLPRLPGSGGVQGLRFWWALLLMLALNRVLNTAFFTVQSTLFDQPDALLALGEAALMAVVTSVLLKRPVSNPTHD
jgi:hypothetical protein